MEIYNSSNGWVYRFGGAWQSAKYYETRQAITEAVKKISHPAAGIKIWWLGDDKAELVFHQRRNPKYSWYNDQPQWLDDTSEKLTGEEFEKKYPELYRLSEIVREAKEADRDLLFYG